MTCIAQRAPVLLELQFLSEVVCGVAVHCTMVRTGMIERIERSGAYGHTSKAEGENHAGMGVADIHGFVVHHPRACQLVSSWRKPQACAPSTSRQEFVRYTCPKFYTKLCIIEALWGLGQIISIGRRKAESKYDCITS